jgi:hypothetical protein
MLPDIAGMTDVHNHTQLLVEMGSWKIFAQMMIPQVLTFPVAKIIGMSHWHPVP